LGIVLFGLSFKNDFTVHSFFLQISSEKKAGLLRSLADEVEERDVALR